MDLVLRPHQVEVVDSLRQQMASQRAVVLYAPTGFGKTECAVQVIQGVIAKGKRVAMVMDRIVLCEQTSARLDKYGIDHGILQSGNKRYRPEMPVQICTVQTLEARESFPAIDLLIVDEAHIHRKSVTEFVEHNRRVRVIGLSATPITKGMSATYEGVVNAVTTEKLVETGWLVPLRVFAAKQIDMSGAKKVAGEWTQRDAGSRGVVITGDVVSEWEKRSTEFFGGPKKTIVFCAGVDHGAHLAKEFCARGHNFVNISYRDDDDYKRDVIENFRKPDSDIVGVIATDILTKGFDVPDVYIGVSARPFSKSLSSHIQQLGRVMRPHEGKEFALWIDHSGNYLRFRSDWDEIYEAGVPSLVDNREKSKAEPTEKEKKQSLCPKCGAVWNYKVTHCLVCGHEKPRYNMVTSREGELFEVGLLGPKMTIEEKQSFLSQLIRYCRITGKRDGWAYYKYKLRVGKFPGTNLARTPSDQVSQEVRDWINKLPKGKPDNERFSDRDAVIPRSTKSWTDGEMQDLYSQLLRYARDNGRKDGWAYYTFRERTGGLEPNGLDKIPSDMVRDVELLMWIKHRQIAWAKRAGR